MKKLIDYVEIVANNEECVVLKVLPNSKEGLIYLGYFTGGEALLRVTKGDDQQFTVFYNDDSTSSWHWGRRGTSCVSNSVKKQGHLIQQCIEQDLDIALRCSPARIKADLRIQSKKDVKNRRHTIAVMGNNEDCVHKDNAYYRCTSGLPNIMDHFKELGWTIMNKPTKTIANNGCPIWTFDIAR